MSEPAGRPDGAMVSRREILVPRPDLAPTWSAVDRSFPVRVTRSFWERVDKDNPADPLAKQALPDPREMLADPGDRLDPVGELGKSPLPWAVHKHPDRVLLLLTKRCHLYCRYCFRRNIEPGEGADPTDAEWEAALDYAAGSGAHEVIFSGGDPLATRDARIFEAIDRLRPTIPVIRIHTRAPITKPDRVTAELVEGLRERGPVWVIVHCNHPNELAPDVDEALARMVDAGIPVLNQSVLLEGVNDDVDTLVRLSEALVRRRVFPYYLHHTDPASGNAHFRVPVERGLAIHAELRKRVSGIGLPQYVVDPEDGSGKVPVEVRRSP